MITVGMFAKHPAPGTTKTRLARSLGGELAARFSEAFLLDLLDRVPKLADRFLLCATPDSPEACSWFDQHLPQLARLHYQPQASFGDRIDWFFQTAFDDGAQAAVLVGSDSPDLPDTVISNAIRKLRHVDVVFCPSTDGGFTMVGMNGYHQGLFNPVRFSSQLTLNESIDAAAEAGLNCELLNPWYDVDEIQDLCLLRSRILMDSAVRTICRRSADVFQTSWGEIKAVLRNLEDRELHG